MITRIAKNQLWCALVSLASELLARTQLLAFTSNPDNESTAADREDNAPSASSPAAGHAARRWEPKRMRLRLLSAAGRLTTSGRRRRLHLAGTGKWTQLLLHAISVLRALPAPT